MNKFTQDFFQGQFPGFSVDCNYEEIMSDFWHTKKLPFVELDFTVDTQPTYQWLLKNKQLFDKTPTQHSRELNKKEYGVDWFTDAHSQGWLELKVTGAELERDYIVNCGIEMPHHHTEELANNLQIDLVNQLNKINLPVTRIKLLCLEPNGWAQPHMDRLKPGHATMNHVWLPLHNFKPSLKVYPYGTIEHKTGHLYLLNQQSFIHSVINPESMSRFVAVLTLDYENLSVDMWEQIKQSVYRQWFE